MPRYISIEEVKEEVPELVQGLITDDSADKTVIEDDYITQKVTAAEQEAESYLSTRYAIPLKSEDGTVPAQLKQHIFVILKYHLYGRRQAIDAGLADQYSKTIRFLEQVAIGKANIALLTEEGDIESEGSVGEIVVGQLKSPSFNRIV